MKCPECTKSIGFFAPALRGPSHERHCPHCYALVRLTMNLKAAAILLLPFSVAGYLMKPVFGSWGLPLSLAVGIATGMLCIKRASRQTVTGGPSGLSALSNYALKRSVRDLSKRAAGARIIVAPAASSRALPRPARRGR